MVVGALVQIFRINFRYGQAVTAKMPREFEECGVLFPNVVQDSNRTEFVVGEPDDIATGAAELALQRLHALGRRVEMLLKEFLENVHEELSTVQVCTDHHKDNIMAIAERTISF